MIVTTTNSIEEMKIRIQKMLANEIVEVDNGMTMLTSGTVATIE